MQIIAGDVLDVLSKAPDNTYNAVLTDPPYGLSKEPDMQEVLTHWLNGDDYKHRGSGFLGKKWDSFVPGPAVWKEVYRVCKPGAILLAFCGTRTSDLMSIALRLGGWSKFDEIDVFGYVDWISYVYSCLSEDTEILTDKGWKLGVNLDESDKVAQWNPDNSEITFTEYENHVVQDYEGEMIRFAHSDADHLVTPNHRVYHRRKEQKMTDGTLDLWYSDIVIEEASKIRESLPIKIPTSGFHNGEGIGGENYASLLGWVWTEGGFDKNGNGVRVYQSSTNAEYVNAISNIVSEYDPKHKLYTRDRKYRKNTYTEYTWFISGSHGKRIRKDLPNKEVTYELLFRMTHNEKVAFYNAAISGDGSVCSNTGSVAFYQNGEKNHEWFLTLLSMIGLRGKTSAHKKQFVSYVNHRDSVEFQHRHRKDSSEMYEGRVWCVTVPTGAFVARRRGMIFITGNSGFPKSFNLSRQFDKRENVQGKVVSSNSVPDQRNGHGREYGSHLYAHSGRGNIEHKHYAPVSEEARRWFDYGTSLNPAHEVILLFRKPREGTYLDNAEKYNTGVLNIGGTRIPTEGSDREKHLKEWDRIQSTEAKNSVATHSGLGAIDLSSYAKEGRWTKNVLFVDREDSYNLSTELEEQGGESKSHKSHRGAGINGNLFKSPEYDSTVRGYDDKGTIKRFFYTSKSSRKERNLGLEENENRHPTIKPIDLCKYLATLIVPPEDRRKESTLLVPFSGAGSEMIGAMLAGWENIVGIEQDEDYCSLASRRFSYWKDVSLFIGSTDVKEILDYEPGEYKQEELIGVDYAS